MKSGAVFFLSFFVIAASQPSKSYGTSPIAVSLQNSGPYVASRIANECGLTAKNEMVQINKDTIFFFSRFNNETTLPYTADHFKCLESKCQVVSFAQQGTRTSGLFYIMYPSGQFLRTGICITKEIEVPTKEGNTFAEVNQAPQIPNEEKNWIQKTCDAIKSFFKNILNWIINLF